MSARSIKEASQATTHNSTKVAARKMGKTGSFTHGGRSLRGETILKDPIHQHGETHRRKRTHEDLLQIHQLDLRYVNIVTSHSLHKSNKMAHLRAAPALTGSQETALKLTIL